MRIYDLHKVLDGLIDNGKYQVEFIGEAKCWTVHVARRVLGTPLGDNVHEELGGGTFPDFLSALDFASDLVKQK